MYATLKDFYRATLEAAKAYPAEREKLKAINAVAKQDGLEAGIAAFADWQNTITGNGKAESPQPVVDGAATQNALPGGSEGQSPVAPESAQMCNDAPDDALHTDAGQEVTESAITQSALPGEVQALSVASESTQTGTEPAGDTLRTSASQGASTGTTAQGTLSGTADSQPDDALVRLRAQIDGCLVMETDPILRVFLQQIQHDCLTCSIDTLRREIETYLRAESLYDFLNRLAVLRWQRALDDIAADPGGKRVTRGNAGDRKAVLARLQTCFEQEADAVLRLHLAKIARQAVTDPLGARNEVTGYDYGRTDWEWVWFITVGTLRGAENAFRWRLERARRQVQAKDVWLLNLLDETEQMARKNPPRAISNLEALTKVAAVLDRQADTAQDVTDNSAAGLPATAA